MRKLIVVASAVLMVGMLAVMCFTASNTTPDGTWQDSTVETAVPIDVTGWVAGVTYSTNTTTTPYIPADASLTVVVGETLSVPIYTRHFNGILIRAKYDRTSVITTTPVIRAWGYRNSSWQALPDSSGNYDITLASDAVKDCDDGTISKWTLHKKIPHLGSYKVLLTLSTAFNVTYSTGASVEMSRY